MTDEQNLIAYPLLESHMAPDDAGNVAMIALATIQGKFAATLTPLDASALALKLLEWSAATRDPEDIVVDSEPMVVEDVAFESSNMPGHVRLQLILGTSKLLFELPGDLLAAAIAQPRSKAPD